MWYNNLLTLNIIKLKMNSDLLISIIALQKQRINKNSKQSIIKLKKISDFFYYTKKKNKKEL